MPSKKKKYNARFPAGRIKKIMQSDEEIGKVAQAVPVIISRTLELFVESLLNKTLKITNSRNAKTLSTSHMKQCIMAEQRFDFLRELVKNVPDISVAEEAANYNEDDVQSSPEQQNYPDSDTPYDLSMQSTSTRATRAKSNGDFQQPPMSNQYAENGSVAATAKHMPTHEEHMRAFVEERRAHLKRQAAMATQSLAEDMGVSPQRICAASKIYDKDTQVHASRDTDLAKLVATNASINQRALIPKEQLFVHENERIAHLDREAVIRKQIGQRQTIENPNIAAPSSSVIRHTTSLSTAAHVPHLPPKLYRTDSAPATAAGNWQTQNHQAMSSYKKTLNTQHQRRLKHQPQSEPTGFNELASSNVSIAPHIATTLPPIPAPIVNIDFCNKPVVKIEYSNLAIPAKKSILPIAPLSAPASIANKNATGFNFDSEPVINIDLSNIVANSANTRNDPAVATISIGNIATMPSFLNPLVAAPLNKQINNNSTNPACRNAFSSSSALETKKDEQSITVTTAAVSSSSSTIAPKNNNCFFELDEDYDNI